MDISEQKKTYSLAGSIRNRIKIGEVCSAREVFSSCTSQRADFEASGLTTTGEATAAGKRGQGLSPPRTLQMQRCDLFLRRAHLPIRISKGLAAKAATTNVNEVRTKTGTRRL